MKLKDNSIRLADEHSTSFLETSMWSYETGYKGVLKMYFVSLITFIFVL